MTGAFDFLLTDRNLPGFWDPVTSTIDWCELNYHYSIYIAEFCNTMTNIPGLIANAYLAYMTYQSGVPTRYAMGYVSGMMIGLGSTGFHSTLKWTWQLLDEFPMIYCVSFVAYLAVDSLPGFELRWGIAGPLILFAWNVFATVYYIMSANPVVHQITFAIIMSTAVFYSTYLSYRLPAQLKSKALSTIWKGVGVFVVGFAIWNLDNHMCHHLRDFRDLLSANHLGFLAPLTEGHAYWHLLTSLGSMQLFTGIIATVLMNKTSPEDWDYDSSLWLPYVYAVDATKKK